MVAGNGLEPQLLYCCRSCGAPLEVRVGFRGKLVWSVEPQSAAFGETEPEMRGEYQEPQLNCSADVMHPTGFTLEDGVIASDPKFNPKVIS